MMHELFSMSANILLWTRMHSIKVSANVSHHQSRQRARCQQATLETPAYVKRLGFTWLAFFSVIGGPIAYQTFDPAAQVEPCSLALTLHPCMCI